MEQQLRINQQQVQKNLDFQRHQIELQNQLNQGQLQTNRRLELKQQQFNQQVEQVDKQQPRQKQQPQHPGSLADQELLRRQKELQNLLDQVQLKLEGNRKLEQQQVDQQQPRHQASSSQTKHNQEASGARALSRLKARRSEI